MPPQSDQDLLQSLSSQLQKYQDDLETAIQARQTLESQQTENQSVQREFAGLKNKDEDSVKIYKIVGPVLLKQERTEAVSAVDGRLEFIGKEIKRTEEKIKEVQEGKRKLEVEAMRVQERMQSQGAGGGG